MNHLNIQQKPAVQKENATKKFATENNQRKRTEKKSCPTR